MAQHTEPQPRLVLDKAKTTAAFSGLLSILTTLGFIASPLADQISQVGVAVIGAVFLVLTTVPHIVSALHAEKVVTPVVSPRDDLGNDLVPAGSAPATLDAQIALAEAQEIHPA